MAATISSGNGSYVSAEFHSTNLPQLNADVLKAVKSVDERIILVLCTSKEEIRMSFDVSLNQLSRKDKWTAVSLNVQQWVSSGYLGCRSKVPSTCPCSSGS